MAGALGACSAGALALAFGVVLSVVGDRSATWSSRCSSATPQVKDAGTLLPGMGGVLDRIDSPLLAIPVMYYLMLFYVFLRAGLRR